MDDLTGRLLVAMPSMGDERFARAVIFVCAHGEGGAMGIVINRGATDMSLADLAAHLEVEVRDPRDLPVHMGGPVEPGRGFVLHSDDWDGEVSTTAAGAGFALTSTRDAVEALAQGGGPEKALVALGYSGWGEGQLESELVEGAWLIAGASAELVFAMPDDEKWNAALASIGVDPVSLSSLTGRA